MVEVSRRQRLVGAMIALGVVLVTIFVISRPEAGPAAYNLIGPEHVPAGSELISEGPVDPESASHPLSLISTGNALSSDEATYTYVSVEEYVAFTPHATAVMSYRYTYETAAAAERAAQALAEGSAAHEGATPLDDSALAERFEGSAVHGIRVEGNEPGNILYWLIVPTDRHLQLLVVDGFDEDAVAATLDEVLDRWLADPT